MLSDPRWLILIIGNCILLFLMQLINDTLATVTIYLCPYALFIFAPSILVPYTTGLPSVFVIGLFLDAASALPPGTTALILVIVYTACSWFHQKFKTYSSWHNVLILQCTNAIIFAFLGVFINPSNYVSGYYWASIFINLCFSQLALLFIAPWFLALQCSLFNLFRSKLSSFSVDSNFENSRTQDS